jgi:hypothetical protein
LVTCKTVLLGDGLHSTPLFLNFDISQSQHILDQCTGFFIFYLVKEDTGKFQFSTFQLILGSLITIFNEGAGSVFLELADMPHTHRHITNTLFTANRSSAVEI